MLYNSGESVLMTGTAQATVHQADGSVDYVVSLEIEEVKRWMLSQTAWLNGDVLHLWGTLIVIEIGADPVWYAGGWTYSAEEGAQEDPDSDVGFHDGVANMFACAPQQFTATGAVACGFSVSDTLRMVVNLVEMAINYVLDLAIAYEPATSCDGPLIYDGAGQSCHGVPMPCDVKLPKMCEKIDDLPGVSNAFKQCMQGRCGCGGSHHKRLKISCADPNDCGPCSYTVAYGCNIAGSRMWYCDTTPLPCPCVNTVFHEMSHACGALDQTGESYRIGDWFEGSCILTGKCGVGAMELERLR